MLTRDPTTELASEFRASPFAQDDRLENTPTKPNFKLFPPLYLPPYANIVAIPRPEKNFFASRIHMEFISSWYNIMIKCLSYDMTLKGIIYE